LILTRGRQPLNGILVWALAAIVVSMTVYFYSRAATPAYIHIRWRPDVDARTRLALEEKFHLTQAEVVDTRTWSYRIRRTSAANLETILRDPHVEDTDGIDRDRLRLFNTPKPREGSGTALLVGFGLSTVGCWAWSRLRTT